MNQAMQRPGADLEKVVAQSLRKAPAAEAPILAWALACGSAVAERTRALEFALGVLRVEVPDEGWRRELQALAPRYLAALNRYVTESVTRVEFVVAPVSAGKILERAARGELPQRVQREGARRSGREER